ncbi:hypothetical protein XPA_010089 [Xanthoria parietina]
MTFGITNILYLVEIESYSTPSQMTARKDESALDQFTAVQLRRQADSKPCCTNDGHSLTLGICKCKPSGTGSKGKDSEIFWKKKVEYIDTAPKGESQRKRNGLGSLRLDRYLTSR